MQWIKVLEIFNRCKQHVHIGIWWSDISEEKWAWQRKKHRNRMLSLSYWLFRSYYKTQATSRHTSKLLQTGRRVPVQTMHTTDTQKWNLLHLTRSRWSCDDSFCFLWLTVDRSSFPPHSLLWLTTSTSIWNTKEYLMTTTILSLQFCGQ